MASTVFNKPLDNEVTENTQSIQTKTEYVYFGESSNTEALICQKILSYPLYTPVVFYANSTALSIITGGKFSNTAQGVFARNTTNEALFIAGIALNRALRIKLDGVTSSGFGSTSVYDFNPGRTTALSASNITSDTDLFGIDDGYYLLSGTKSDYLPTRYGSLLKLSDGRETGYSTFIVHGTTGTYGGMWYRTGVPNTTTWHTDWVAVNGSDTGIPVFANTAPRAIEQGEYINWLGKLVRAKSAISSGGTLSSSNVDEVTDGGFNALRVKYVDTTFTTNSSGNYNLGSTYAMNKRVVLGIYNDRTASNYDTTATFFTLFTTSSQSLNGNLTARATDLDGNAKASTAFKVRIFYLEL